MKRSFPLVEVLWEDAAHLPSGWMHDIPAYEPIVVSSVGYLLESSKQRVLLSMDVDLVDGEHNQRAQIPRGMVKKVKVLRKADKVK